MNAQIQREMVLYYAQLEEMLASTRAAKESTIIPAAVVVEIKRVYRKLAKPLQREIHLFDTYIAGTTYLKDKSVLENIVAGDRLILQREDNKFDEKAILVLNEKKQKLGYVPERDNIVFSRLMDAGKFLTAKVLNKEQKGTFTQIRICIFLVDF